MTETILHVDERSVLSPKPKNSRLVKIEKGISTLCMAIAALSLIGITLLTVAEVISRNVASRPLGWNVAIVEQYLMMAMAFFGAVTAYYAGAHIAVATVYDRFPEAVRRVLTVLAHLIVFACFALLFWAGTGAAWFSLRLGEAPVPGMAELPLPTWWWRSIMPAASVLGAFIALCEIWHALRGGHVPDHQDIIQAELSEGI